MPIKKIIPCMDIKNGRVVKGTKFENIEDVANPVEMAKYYMETGADVLIFYDIAASAEQKPIFYDLIRKVKAEISIPYVVGGGIQTIEDADRVMNCGADKISINSGVIKRPAFVAETVKKYGSSAVILSMDVKQVDGVYRVFSNAGTTNTGIDALEWTKQGVENGAGELVINSIDTDGAKCGYDIEMLERISSLSNTPIIASGGAGIPEDFYEALKIKNVESALAARVFHYKEINIRDLKQYLKKKGIEVLVN